MNEDEGVQLEDCIENKKKVIRQTVRIFPVVCDSLIEISPVAEKQNSTTDNDDTIRTTTTNQNMNKTQQQQRYTEEEIYREMYRKKEIITEEDLHITEGNEDKKLQPIQMRSLSGGVVPILTSTSTVPH